MVENLTEIVGSQELKTSIPYIFFSQFTITHKNSSQIINFITTVQNNLAQLHKSQFHSHN
jgi:hypothetical protein